MPLPMPLLHHGTMADFAENGVVLKGPLVCSAALRSLARSLRYAPLHSAPLRSLVRSLMGRSDTIVQRSFF